MKSITFDQFFEKWENGPLLDVRSPGEYLKGHVPNAVSMPLFNDAERAEVGTLYKQQSKEAAVLRGLDIAGAKLSWFVKEAQNLIEGKDVAVHCWRGGKRSGSIATLLQFVGYEVAVLKGGYKAYRNLLLKNFTDKKLNLIVLGGKTGSGKTEILHQLKAAGEQVIDLEGLAHHKGSVFGALGEKPQPTVEQFENDLYEVFRKLDPSLRVWVENESKSIGRVYLPDGIWGQLCTAHFIEIEIPLERRIRQLVEGYGRFSREELVGSLQKISKRLGGLDVKNATQAYDEGDLETATRIALGYYDKAYQLASDKKDFKAKHHLEMGQTNAAVAASQLIDFANDHY